MSKAIKKLIKTVVRRVFWLKPENASLITKEAGTYWKNESALMNHIVEQWFEKKGR